MTRTMAINDLFTEEELRKAAELHEECGGTGFHGRALAEIVNPAMERIDRVTGQRNDPSYMAYALEYAVSQARPGPK